MRGSIEVVPPKKLVGLSFSGTFPALVAEMPKVWESFLQRQGEIPFVIQPSICYDVSQENHAYQWYTEYVVTEVERFEEIPPGMIGITLPERTYARFTHTGPMEQVQQTYRQAFQWLGDEGYRIDETALRMERYDERYIPARHPRERAENAYDIFIPIL
ncbi:GyrI-like domain-containing protein [Brevibacillus sp. GCM10020057]|uniref:GyrI-like domain-containing protein n=1 Tax=Brevibacillus sp. GCM10020057 TaxID=3317327 RepID=UPI003636FA5E